MTGPIPGEMNPMTLSQQLGMARQYQMVGTPYMPPAAASQYGAYGVPNLFSSLDYRLLMERTIGILNAGTPVMPYNPMRPFWTAGAAVQSVNDYRDQLYGTRALLGSAAVNEGRLQAPDFTNALNRIGVTRSEVLDVMNQLASASGRVAENLDKAAQNIATLARNTGLNREALTTLFGAAARGSNLAATDTQRLQLFQDAYLIGGRQMVNVLPTMQALQSFRELNKAYGGVPFEGQAESILSSMERLNPTLYRTEPGLAVQHFQQLQNFGSGPLLGLMMSAARRRGGTGANRRGPITIADVMADVQQGLDYTRDVYQQQLSGTGHEAMRTFAALNGVSPLFLRESFENGPTSGFGADYTRDTNGLPMDLRSFEAMLGGAAMRTTARQQAVASFYNQYQNTTGPLSQTTDFFNRFFGNLSPTERLLGEGLGMAYGLRFMRNIMGGGGGRTAATAAEEAAGAARSFTRLMPRSPYEFGNIELGGAERGAGWLARAWQALKTPVGDVLGENMLGRGALRAAGWGAEALGFVGELAFGPVGLITMATDIGLNAATSWYSGRQARQEAEEEARQRPLVAQALLHHQMHVPMKSIRNVREGEWSSDDITANSAISQYAVQRAMELAQQMGRAAPRVASTVRSDAYDRALKERQQREGLHIYTWRNTHGEHPGDVVDLAMDPSMIRPTAALLRQIMPQVGLQEEIDRDKSGRVTRSALHIDTSSITNVPTDLASSPDAESAQWQQVAANLNQASNALMRAAEAHEAASRR